MTLAARRLLAVSAAGLLSVGLLAGCGGDSVDKAVDKATDGKVQLDKNGNQITVKDGDNSISIGDTELPKSFPDGQVPLPDGGDLKAVLSGKHDGKTYYSLTYTIRGDDLKSAAKDYRTKLEDDGYRIESSSAVGGSSGSFTAFTAVGTDWDVIVYSGGSDAAAGAMSLQVTTHDASTSSSSTGADRE